MTRVVLVTGKGGVGKTTTAAATALRAARRGRRTLVVSTDPAHSLADALDVGLGSSPTTVAGGLDGQQLDAQELMERTWGDVQGYVRQVLAWGGLEGLQAEELSVLPGLEEVLALAELEGHIRSEAYDLLVVDCAPTAETLRLLALPDALSRYLDRLFPVGRTLARVVGPVVASVSNLPVPGEAVFGGVERLHQRLTAVRELLADPARCSVRIVVNPEQIVVAEARRTFTYLSLFGFQVDAVIANRLLPEEVADPWFDGWKQLQGEHLRTIEEGFAPVPVLRSPLADTEVVGLERLERFGAALYGEVDPAAILHTGAALELEDGPGGPSLRLPLPFAAPGDVRLARKGPELLLRIGPYRRAVLLPDALRRRRIVDAVVRDGALHVTFAAASVPA